LAVDPALKTLFTLAIEHITFCTCLRSTSFWRLRATNVSDKRTLSYQSVTESW